MMVYKVEDMFNMVPHVTPPVIEDILDHKYTPGDD